MERTEVEGGKYWKLEKREVEEAIGDEYSEFVNEEVAYLNEEV